ncbi:uncharacterized protein SCHCODRAFT_02435894, partial [Schizophyllum commune H4-8]
MRTGASLRLLFATILLHCEPAHPGDLWASFCEQICDDLPRRLQRMNFPNPSIEDACDYGLY